MKPFLLGILAGFVLCIAIYLTWQHGQVVAPEVNHKRVIDSLVNDKVIAKLEAKLWMDSTDFYKRLSIESEEKSVRDQMQKIFFQKKYENDTLRNHRLRPNELDSALIARYSRLNKGQNP